MRSNGINDILGEKANEQWIEGQTSKRPPGSGAAESFGEHYPGVDLPEEN
jgi:hypothetical protein